MRSIISATVLSAALALALPALAQSGSAQPGSGQPGGAQSGSMGTPGASGGAMGGTGSQMQGNMPGSPLPMTQPGPGTMSDSQRPSTAAGALGATSGSQSMTMDESQVRDLLRSQGYGEVQSVTRDGDQFRARAMRNGRPADITVDAYTGTIRNQAARR